MCQGRPSLMSEVYLLVNLFSKLYVIFITSSGALLQVSLCHSLLSIVRPFVYTRELLTFSTSPPEP